MNEKERIYKMLETTVRFDVSDKINNVTLVLYERDLIGITEEELQNFIDVSLHAVKIEIERYCKIVNNRNNNLKEEERNAKK